MHIEIIYAELILAVCPLFYNVFSFLKLSLQHLIFCATTSVVWLIKQLSLSFSK